MTHWLNHSLVLAADYRIRKALRVVPPLERRRGALAGTGAHHVLVYASTTDPSRVMVLIAIHPRESVIELLRRRVFFDWFDAVGVDDIPAVFAGQLLERLDLVEDTHPDAPEVMVAVVTPVDDVVGLIVHVRETVSELRAAGIRRMSIFSAFDDPGEVMMLFQVDEEGHARHWLRDSDLSSEWLGRAGIGAYPPVFVGRLQQMLRIEESDSTNTT